MATETQTGRSRQATPARWRRALERALFAGVECRQLADTGEWIVTSASKPDLAHRTDGISCTCEAALLGADPICLHRAMLWHVRGVLDLDDPEPTPPTPAVVCFKCRGLDSACSVCRGNGKAALDAQSAALLDAADRLAA